MRVMAVLAQNPGYPETEHMGHDFKSSFIKTMTDQASFTAAGTADRVELEVIDCIVINIL